MIYITPEQAVALHDSMAEATGGDSGVRDRGLLESALLAPFQAFGGVEPYPTHIQKAARLCYGLVLDHPFVDGNKRMGAHVMLLYLALNGVRLSYTQAELAEVILSVARGESSAEDIAAWLLAHEA